MTRLKKATLLLSFLAVTTLVLFGVRYVPRWLDAYQVSQTAKDILPLLGIDDSDTPTMIFDKAREFVNKHSWRNTKTPENHAYFYKYWKDNSYLINHMFRYAKEEEVGIPIMECSVRSAQFAAILKALGYPSRTAVVFKPGFSSHTFLDVFNTETQQWEAQDADVNIYWVHKISRQRISAQEIVENGQENVLPCRNDYCGWDIPVRSGEYPDNFSASEVREYLDIVSIIDKPNDYRKTFFNKASLHKKEAFCEVLPKNC